MRKFYRFMNFSINSALFPKKRVYDYTLSDLESAKASIKNLDIEWKDIKTQASFDAIKQAERAFKSSLPAEMVALISMYNGARPDKDRVDTNIQTGVRIKTLLSIDRDDPDNVSPLKWMTKMNIAVYPFALTDQNDYIVLGRTDGKVYWMSKDIRSKMPFQYIADSPLDFLKKLYSLKEFKNIN